MAANLEKRLRSYVDAVAKGDRAGIKQFLAPEFKLLPSGSPNVINDPDAMVDQLLKLRQDAGFARLDITPQLLFEVRVLTDAEGFTSAAYQAYDKSGNAMPGTVFKDVILWRLISGEWMFYRGIYNV